MRLFVIPLAFALVLTGQSADYRGWLDKGTQAFRAARYQEAADALARCRFKSRLRRSTPLSRDYLGLAVRSRRGNTREPGERAKGRSRISCRVAAGSNESRCRGV